MDPHCWVIPLARNGYKWHMACLGVQGKLLYSRSTLMSVSGVVSKRSMGATVLLGSKDTYCTKGEAGVCGCISLSDETQIFHE